MSEGLLCDVRPPIAELVLNRPEAGNALTPEMFDDLAEATTRLATEPEIRAVVLRGHGPHFCLGASVDLFSDRSLEERPALIRDLVTKFHLAITRLTRLEIPVLGVGHGTVVGGGLSLLAACDVVLAAESTRFRVGWTGLGITMDAGASWLLPRIIGLHRALEIFHTNRLFSGAEAEDWGLVNWLVPDEDIDARTAELAAMLADGPTLALGWCKRLIYEAMSCPLDAQLENEATTLVRAVATADSDEGIRAFQEHRTPNFRGR